MLLEKVEFVNQSKSEDILGFKDAQFVWNLSDTAGVEVPYMRGMELVVHPGTALTFMRIDRDERSTFVAPCDPYCERNPNKVVDNLVYVRESDSGRLSLIVGSHLYEREDKNAGGLRRYAVTMGRHGGWVFSKVAFDDTVAPVCFDKGKPGHFEVTLKKDDYISIRQLVSTLDHLETPDGEKPTKAHTEVRLFIHKLPILYGPPPSSGHALSQPKGSSLGQFKIESAAIDFDDLTSTKRRMFVKAVIRTPEEERKEVTFTIISDEPSKWFMPIAGIEADGKREIADLILNYLVGRRELAVEIVTHRSKWNFDKFPKIWKNRLRRSDHDRVPSQPEGRSLGEETLRSAGPGALAVIQSNLEKFGSALQSVFTSRERVAEPLESGNEDDGEGEEILTLAATAAKHEDPNARLTILKNMRLLLSDSAEFQRYRDVFVEALEDLDDRVFNEALSALVEKGDMEVLGKILESEKDSEYQERKEALATAARKLRDRLEGTQTEESVEPNAVVQLAGHSLGREPRRVRGSAIAKILPGQVEFDGMIKMLDKEHRSGEIRIDKVVKLLGCVPSDILWAEIVGGEVDVPVFKGDDGSYGRSTVDLSHRGLRIYTKAYVRNHPEVLDSLARSLVGWDKTQGHSLGSQGGRIRRAQRRGANKDKDHRGKEKRLPKMKVLVVDDHPDIPEVMARILKRYNDSLEITIARDGIEGLREVEDSEGFSVIFADISMPGMNGIEFVTRVRKENPDVHIVMISSVDDISKKLQSDGVINAILKKPLDVTNRELLAREIEKAKKTSQDKRPDGSSLGRAPREVLRERGKSLGSEAEAEVIHLLESMGRSLGGVLGASDAFAYDTLPRDIQERYPRIFRELLKSLFPDEASGLISRAPSVVRAEYFLKMGFPLNIAENLANLSELLDTRRKGLAINFLTTQSVRAQTQREFIKTMLMDNTNEHYCIFYNEGEDISNTKAIFSDFDMVRFIEVKAGESISDAMINQTRSPELYKLARGIAGTRVIRNIKDLYRFIAVLAPEEVLDQLVLEGMGQLVSIDRSVLEGEDDERVIQGARILELTLTHVLSYWSGYYKAQGFESSDKVYTLIKDKIGDDLVIRQERGINYRFSINLSGVRELLEGIYAAWESVWNVSKAA